MDDSESTTQADAQQRDGGLLAWLRRLWRRIAGPRPPLLMSDIVSPDALPICPECTERYHPLAHQCHRCGELVGPYRAWIYPDLVWVWGRGLWRLMERHSVSRLVWMGMVVLALGWLGQAFGLALYLFGSELGGLSRPMWSISCSISLAFSLIAVVAGIRMLAKAWRL